MEHTSSYYAATANPDARFPKLESDLTADVAIIGGGFTGVATALELAERGLSVVLCEANQIGWGATGRNGGQITGSLSGDKAMERESVTRRRTSFGICGGAGTTSSASGWPSITSTAI